MQTRGNPGVSDPPNRIEPGWLPTGQPTGRHILRPSTRFTRTIEIEIAIENPEQTQIAYLEIKHALLPAENSVPQEFVWITLDADPNVEVAALEWNTDKGFCFRLRADLARQLAAKLTQTLSDT